MSGRSIVQDVLKKRHRKKVKSFFHLLVIALAIWQKQSKRNAKYLKVLFKT